MGDIEIFKKCGINVRFRTDKASRNIASSVSYVRGFFESASNERRVHVSDTCKNIIEDFENYRYPEEVEGKMLSNDPIKDGFYEHGCDAFRYFITNRFPMIDNQLIRIAR
jgi:phage terminase large subunit